MESSTDVPENIKQKLDNLDEEQLRSVASYAKKCADKSSCRDEKLPVKSNVEPCEFTDRVHEFIEQKQTYAESVSVWQFHRRCDGGCDECPHGPYFRGSWVESGTRHSKHLGSADE